MRLRINFALFLILYVIHLGHATHNRAGEITFQQTDELTIRVTITTYTKTSSSPNVDRDSLEVFWGDGTSSIIPRDNGQGTAIDNDVKINYYIADHTYPGRATYTISFMDPNRVENILNIDPPNSVDVPFYLETQFTFLNTQFQGINNSPILLQPPLDFACVGKRFVHNPNAYDPDGDSLAYELIVPLQLEDTPVPDYQFPDQVAPGINNNAGLNPITGEFVWNSPQIQGEYNIAIRINEYRNGTLISSIVRDMQILVRVCNDSPPVIESIDELCVIAGERIDIDLLIDDPDVGQQVLITASGGPMLLENGAAELSIDSVYMDVQYTSVLTWQTKCEHISEQYYQIVVRAVDNIFGESGLATLKTIRIKVVGPPPENVMGNVESENIRIAWDFPYSCQNATKNYFQGFSIWRKSLSTPFPIDTCQEGLDGRGYEKIVFITLQNDGTQYFHLDSDVERGKTYCYRILAEFALSTMTGNPFNRVESLPSEEICMQLARDIPLLTNVSITETDESTGKINVAWAKPLANDLDTLDNPGPYRYQLMHSIDNINFNAISAANFERQHFAQDVDSVFLDIDRNTENNIQYYRVDFYTGGSLYGSSLSASSVYIDVRSSDESNILTWEYETPWQNYSFEILRGDNKLGPFVSIEETSDREYTDRDLTNGVEYCYFVRSSGTYGLDGLPDPLINDSQVDCNIPMDNVPPCPIDTLHVQSICDNIDNISSTDDLINTLSWSNPNKTCEETNDVAGYNVYYKNQISDQFELLATVDGSDNISYNHVLTDGTLGCYAISALDSLGNESDLSPIICIENCPIYELPNTFTPNNDGANDLFTPTKSIFVDHVEFEVFNRWGNLVFQTQDPQLNWDGTKMGTEELTDGTYYYNCRIFEQSGDDVVERQEILSGYIHLIRG